MRPLLWIAALSSTLFAADVAQEGKRWWSHIQVLADDKMEGRNTGSEGHRKAAQFVAGEFERAGLKPAGSSGYLQPVKFNVTQIAEELALSVKTISTYRVRILEKLKMNNNAEMTRYAIKEGLVD